MNSHPFLAFSYYEINKEYRYAQVAFILRILIPILLRIKKLLHNPLQFQLQKEIAQKAFLSATMQQQKKN